MSNALWEISANAIKERDELLSALEALLESHPVYPRPIGSPGSVARGLWESQVEAEKTAREVIAKVKGVS